MSAEFAMRAMLCGLVLCGSGTLAVAEEEVPELEFLEYLGMWEETDEDWLMLEDATTADNEERSDPAPEGEASTEKENEG